ncbi:PREDICTED: uncharacterized protein LOC105588346 [Cercocebus atys]|uniref:uncharacterized protein LOC105588346 n=1 Tax=Cercocebus atys TaxID=9531 RepID=UPI0005F4D336|nr:PREDICTED: uncharacterized protein LOC105588346 [Cercocebus atys]
MQQMLWGSTSNPSSGPTPPLQMLGTLPADSHSCTPLWNCGQVKGQHCSRAPCRILKAARFGTPGVRSSSTSAVAVQAALPLRPQNPADVKALCLSVDFPSWRPHCCFKYYMVWQHPSAVSLYTLLYIYAPRQGSMGTRRHC